MTKTTDNFKTDDEKVYLKKFGNTIYVIPYLNPWQCMIDSLNEFSENFMDDYKQPK